jgi:hypothetical protein
MGVTRSDAIQTIFTRTRWRARASIAPPEKHRRNAHASQPPLDATVVGRQNPLDCEISNSRDERKNPKQRIAGLTAMLYVEAVLKVREVPLKSYRKLPACEMHR